jgi:hypothetical protein
MILCIVSAIRIAFCMRLSAWCFCICLEFGTQTNDLLMILIWQTNTMIYQDVFSCVPNDLIHTRYDTSLIISPTMLSNWVRARALTDCFLSPTTRRAALRQSMVSRKDRLGHTTIDLGIAPQKLESYQNGDIKNTDPLERLQSTRGHLVSFPLEFMCKEDLRPVFNESEYYASQVFHWVEGRSVPSPSLFLCWVTGYWFSNQWWFLIMSSAIVL